MSHKEEFQKGLNQTGMRRAAIKEELMPSSQTLFKPTRDVSASNKSISINRDSLFHPTEHISEKQILLLQKQLEEREFEREANKVYNRHFKSLAQILGNSTMQFDEIRQRIEEMILNEGNHHPGVTFPGKVNQENNGQLMYLKQRIQNLESEVRKKNNLINELSLNKSNHYIQQGVSNSSHECIKLMEGELEKKSKIINELSESINKDTFMETYNCLQNEIHQKAEAILHLEEELQTNRMKSTSQIGTLEEELVRKNQAIQKLTYEIENQKRKYQTLNDEAQRNYSKHSHLVLTLENESKVTYQGIQYTANGLLKELYSKIQQIDQTTLLLKEAERKLDQQYSKTSQIELDSQQSQIELQKLKHEIQFSEAAYKDYKQQKLQEKIQAEQQLLSHQQEITSLKYTNEKLINNIARLNEEYNLLLQEKTSFLSELTILEGNNIKLEEMIQNERATKLHVEEQLRQTNQAKKMELQNLAELNEEIKHNLEVEKETNKNLDSQLFALQNQIALHSVNTLSIETLKNEKHLLDQELSELHLQFGQLKLKLETENSYYKTQLEKSDQTNKIIEQARHDREKEWEKILEIQISKYLQEINQNRLTLEIEMQQKEQLQQQLRNAEELRKAEERKRVEEHQRAENEMRNVVTNTYSFRLTHEEAIEKYAELEQLNNELQNTLASLQNEGELNAISIQTLNKEVQHLTQQISLLQEQLQKKGEKLHLIMVEMTAKELQIYNLTHSLAEFKHQQTAFTEIQSLNKQLSDLNSAYSQKLEQAHIQIKKLEGQIQQLQAIHQERQEDEHFANAHQILSRLSRKSNISDSNKIEVQKSSQNHYKPSSEESHFSDQHSRSSIHKESESDGELSRRILNDPSKISGQESKFANIFVENSSKINQNAKELAQQAIKQQRQEESILSKQQQSQSNFIDRKQNVICKKEISMAESQARNTFGQRSETGSNEFSNKMIQQFSEKKENEARNILTIKEEQETLREDSKREKELLPQQSSNHIKQISSKFLIKESENFFQHPKTLINFVPASTFTRRPTLIASLKSELHSDSPNQSHSRSNSARKVRISYGLPNPTHDTRISINNTNNIYTRPPLVIDRRQPFYQENHVKTVRESQVFNKMDSKMNDQQINQNSRISHASESINPTSIKSKQHLDSLADNAGTMHPKNSIVFNTLRSSKSQDGLKGQFEVQKSQILGETRPAQNIPARIGTSIATHQQPIDSNRQGISTNPQLNPIILSHSLVKPHQVNYLHESGINMKPMPQTSRGSNIVNVLQTSNFGKIPSKYEKKELEKEWDNLSESQDSGIDVLQLELEEPCCKQ